MGIEAKTFSTHIDALVKQAIQTLTDKGCQVHLVANCTEAAAKIKSLVTEGSAAIANGKLLDDLAVADVLNCKGLDVVQTDLSKFAGLSGPVSEAAFCSGLQNALGNQGSLEDLLEQARVAVRSGIARADYGITGADAVIALHGTLMLVEEEGNARAVSNLPYTHIAVAETQSIVPDLPDAMAIARRMAPTGKCLSAYISLITGPSSTSDIEGVNVKGMHGPKEVHVILIDHQPENNL